MKMIKILFLAAPLILGTNGFANAETIEKIIINGNKKVSRDTILFYMRSTETGNYSEITLRKDFKALWHTGFFENITIEAEEGNKGKIVTLTLTENPLIKSITYKTGKKIKEKDILERLQEKNISILAFSYYSPSKINRVKKVIKDLLQEKGFSEGKVDIITEKAKDQVALTIQVTQGPRTRIGSIVFPGLDTKRVSPLFLQRGMKNNKAHNLLSFLGGKDVFSKEKMAEDLEAVKLKLQEKGYLEAKVGKPSVSRFQKLTALGKKQNMLRLTIPVEMGPQYRVGSIKIVGNKIVKSKFLKGLVTLKKGKLYDVKKREKIREEIQKVYRTLGYIYCLAAPEENLDPVNKVADLTLRINEGEVAYVGKLSFKGNTFTKDHVLRREWLLNEGQRLNMSLLETCITRMRQLGLVDIQKPPEFKPDPNNARKVDINLEVKELNRQSVNFNAGYSGYEGLFVAVGYSTQNFLGRGETLAIRLQTGTRSKQYSLSFTEPYLFNLPASLGFNVHNTSQEYTFLNRKSTGFGFQTSARLWGFWGASLGYSYEDVESTAVYEAETDSYLNALYNYTGAISSLSPTIYYNSVDSPIFPTRGTKILFNYRYSGGLLGGDVNLHKTKFQLVKFIPVWKRHRHTLGFQLVFQNLITFGDKPIPTLEKFFLGGEQSIRGFDYYQVGPRNENGDRIGGNKAFFLNLQYEIPINRSLSTAAFFDMGNAYDFDSPISLKNVYSSLGVELKVFVPMLNVPFRLIFAYTPRTLKKDDDHFAFKFTIGPSFQ